LSEAEARAHLQQEAGRLFDPDVVRELLEAAAASAR
jgi:response regulator RpfG family c-di-GMP phosphodiesterase